jgi:hypothetical protein
VLLRQAAPYTAADDLVVVLVDDVAAVVVDDDDAVVVVFVDVAVVASGGVGTDVVGVAAVDGVHYCTEGEPRLGAFLHK